MIKTLPHNLGIIIPTTTILFLGLSIPLFFMEQCSTRAKLIWTSAIAWLLYTYYLACVTDPGSPRKDYTDEWGVKCKKCDVVKPERTHHCKECNRCVLRMDHHCPWTQNCVGNNNFPHFMRFLFWVVVINGFAFARFIMVWIQVLDNWDVPFSRTYSYEKLTIAFIGVVASCIVEITITLLFLRSILNVINGQTQIETWELERAATIARRLDPGSAPEFPFDVTFGYNWEVALGNFFIWLWPWGGPGTDGHEFPKLFYTSTRWPPATPDNVHDWYTVKRWRTSDGDNITDFGVDAAVDDVNVPYVSPEELEAAAKEAAKEAEAAAKSTANANAGENVDVRSRAKN